MENYLISRETGALFEQRAYIAIRKLWEKFPRPAHSPMNSALRELRKRHSYQAIFQVIEWVQKNGTWPDKQRCLNPVLWLSGNPEKMRAIFHRASAEAFRVRVEESRRHLVSECAAERRRAADVERRALRRFTAEYPTPAERRRAMIRVFNSRPDLFVSVTLEDRAARALCIALIVEGIDALRLAQDEQELAG